MDVKELRVTVDKMLLSLGNDLVTAKTDDEKKLVSFILMGASMLGELLVDVKRIADAAEETRLTSDQLAAALAGKLQ